MFVASHKHENFKGLIGQGGPLRFQDVLALAEGARGKKSRVRLPLTNNLRRLSILMKKSLWNASCCVKAWHAMIYYNGRYRHINPGMKMSSPRHFHERATKKKLNLFVCKITRERDINCIPYMPN